MKWGLRNLLMMGTVFLFTSFLQPGVAQESSPSLVTNQLWLDFNPHVKLSEKAVFWGKVGAKAIFPEEWFKVYTTAEVSYDLPRFLFPQMNYKERVYAGCDFYFISFTEGQNLLEISPYQGFSLFFPNRQRVAVKHNLELGERFQWGLQNLDYSFGLKLSYEASLTLYLQGDVWEGAKGLYLTASAKFWWNLVSANIFNDVMRITPGIGYRINPKWRTAFYVGYNYTRNLNTEAFQTNNIIYRLRVYYSLN